MLVIIGIILWLLHPGPEHEIVEFMGEGYYHATQKYFGEPVVNLKNVSFICSRPDNCYEGYLWFTGNITYISEVYQIPDYIEGKKLNGYIDILWRDSLILGSDKYNHRTPIKLHFKGYVDEGIILTDKDWIIVGLISVIVSLGGYIVYKSKKLFKYHKFSAEDAKVFFKKRCNDEFYDIVSPLRVSTPREDIVPGEKLIFVGADLRKVGEHTRNFYIMGFDKLGTTHGFLPDEAGFLRKAIFDKEGLDYAMKFSSSQQRYTTHDVQDAVNKARLEAQEEIKQSKDKYSKARKFKDVTQEKT